MRQRQSTAGVAEALIDAGITVSLTTFENHEFLRDNLGHLLSSAYVREIAISDDCSPRDKWKIASDEILAVAKNEGFIVSVPRTVPEKRPRNSSRLVQVFVLTRGCDKKNLILSRNTSRLGGFQNKRASVELSSNSWVLLLDADNVIPESSLFALAQLRNLRSSEIYCSSHLYLFSQKTASGAIQVASKKRQLGLPWLLFGEPLYLRFFSKLLSSKSAYRRTQAGFFLNTGNFLVNRDFYTECADEFEKKKMANPLAADVVSFSSRWLKSGGSFVLVRGFRYYHRVHKDSFWASTNSRQHARTEESRIATLEASDSGNFPKSRFCVFNIILWTFAIPSDLLNFLTRLRKKAPDYARSVRSARRRKKS